MILTSLPVNCGIFISGRYAYKNNMVLETLSYDATELSILLYQLVY